MYVLACVATFLIAYLINGTIITVLYHRGLTHGAVRLSPRTRRVAGTLGIWLTGLDAKAWVCMHRMHHEFSDTARDPHSPVHGGMLSILFKQLRSYERALIGLSAGKPQYLSVVEDLDFPVSWLIRRRAWYLPYVTHLALAVGVGVVMGWWMLGACYWLGMMTHPLEGWLVNAVGHAVGGRNFETLDNSRNNHVVSWLVLGEGFQNNHHRYPASARFSYRRWEFDAGYLICRALDRMGMVTIERATLMPSFSSTSASS